jgi:hypothetical protein
VDIPIGADKGLFAFRVLKAIPEKRVLRVI